MKTSKNERLKQVDNLISQIPSGRRNSFRKLIQYRLAEHYQVIMSESQLGSFLSSGYSTIADIIILALADVVKTMIQEEQTYTAKIQELQSTN